MLCLLPLREGQVPPDPVTHCRHENELPATPSTELKHHIQPGSFTPLTTESSSSPSPAPAPLQPLLCAGHGRLSLKRKFSPGSTQRSRDEHLGEEHARLKDPAEPSTLPTNLGDSTQGAGSKQLCGVQPPASSAGEAAVWRWEELQAGVVTVAPCSCTLSSSKSFYNTELNHLPKQTTRPWRSSIQAESISKGSREPKPGKQMNSPAVA